MPAPEYSSLTNPEMWRMRVPEEQFRFTFSRSSGPGGQNVNKVGTRVTLLFDLAACKELDERQKRRVGVKLAGRITKHGILRVVSMRHRTQAANRRAAIGRFYELLAAALHTPKPRKPTHVPARSKRARVDDKRERGRVKRLRRGNLLDDRGA